MKHIAVLTPVFPYPNRGVYVGIERHIEGLCYALARIQGVKVEVITSFWNDANRRLVSDSVNNVSIHRVDDLSDKIGRLGGLAQFNFLNLGFQMYRKLKELDRCDYLIFNMPFPYSHLIDIPSLTLLHHYQPIYTFSHLLSVPFENLYFRLTKTNLYVAPSNYTAHMFNKYLGFDASKIEVIPEGVDPRFAMGHGEKIREELGNGCIFLSVGPLTKSKGVLELLHAFRNISDKVPEAKLVYVGSGPLKRLLESEVETLALGKKVLLRGFVDDTELPNYYAACDIFVSSSTLEGFGLVFAEAMKAGKPIIALNSASIAEVVGDAGLLAAASANTKELERNMIKMLTNVQLRNAMAARSRQRSLLYSWENTAALLLMTLESLSSPPPKDTN